MHATPGWPVNVEGGFNRRWKPVNTPKVVNTGQYRSIFLHLPINFILHDTNFKINNYHDFFSKLIWIDRHWPVKGCFNQYFNRRPVITLIDRLFADPDTTRRVKALRTCTTLSWTVRMMTDEKRVSIPRLTTRVSQWQSLRKANKNFNFFHYVDSVPARHISEGAVPCSYCLAPCLYHARLYSALTEFKKKNFALQNVIAIFVFSDSRYKNASNCLQICAHVFINRQKIVPRPRFIHVLDCAQFLLHPALFPT